MCAHPPSNPKSLSTETVIGADSKNSSCRTQPKKAGTILLPWCLLSESQYTKVSAVAVTLPPSLGACRNQRGNQYTAPGPKKCVCWGSSQRRCLPGCSPVGDSVWTPRYKLSHSCYFFMYLTNNCSCMPLPTHRRGNSKGNKMLPVSNTTTALIKRGAWDADTAEGEQQ